MLAMYVMLFISLYFEVFLLMSFLERSAARRGIVKSSLDPAALPHVAIVVPCHNEEKTLRGTMESLLALEYPKEKLEILVVDDGSTDGTLALAREFKGGIVRVFEKANGGKHTAMNVGLANTSADIIGCLDADSFVEKGALLKIAPVFLNTQIAAVTPGIHVYQPKNMLQHMQHVEYRLSIFNRFILAVLGAVFITPGPFSFFRASVIRELGGWRYAHSTEDMEMALRIQSAGHLIANQPSATVYTSTPSTLRALMRQRVRWTYGWLRNAVDYRYMLLNRRFGNLGLLVLPSALISIAAGIYFFLRILLNVQYSISQAILKYQAGGSFHAPHFELFFVPTSAIWFLVLTSIGFILTLIYIGSFIGGHRRAPAATPLFLLFYSFLVPLWLMTAVVRATFKTGVKWK